jgi:glycosyltransferase involved in cell wall biosynthesis
MKINYFSPLLPARSGIAEVTEQIVPALSQYAEVVVWTDQTEWSPALASCAKIRQYDPIVPPWRELNQADLNIYNIGNNVNFHHGILQISQQLPGLVILHDVKLHHLFYGIYRVCQADSEGYVAGVARYYGDVAAQQARQFVMGELPIAAVEDYAMTEWAIGCSAGAVMVHTQSAFQELKAFQRWPIGYQPLAYQGAVIPSRVASPKTPLPYQLIVFGYISYNRRIGSILQALSTMPQKQKFRLDIYGCVDDQDSLCQSIEDYGLKGLVTVHGYVSDVMLDRSLANANLAINLRYPTMGEASLSQLRIWHHALPAMVTQVGWYAEQPPDTVLFVRPTHEVEDIQQHLQQFVENPDRFRAIGLQGRQRLAEHHTPDAYAQGLLEFAPLMAVGDQQSNQHYWLDRASQEVAPWQLPDCGKTELQRITGAIQFLSTVN